MFSFFFLLQRTGVWVDVGELGLVRNAGKFGLRLSLCRTIHRVGFLRHSRRHCPCPCPCSCPCPRPRHRRSHRYLFITQFIFFFYSLSVEYHHHHHFNHFYHQYHERQSSVDHSLLLYRSIDWLIDLFLYFFLTIRSLIIAKTR